MISSLLSNDDFAAVYKQLPAAPRLLAQLGTQLQQPEVDLNQLISVLQRHPRIPDEFLVAANALSSLGTEPSSSLESAVARLGERETFRLAGGAAWSHLCPETIGLYGVPGRQLRDNGLFTALLMEELAVPAGLDPHWAFTAGLLRSAGKVLLDALARRTAELPPFVDGSAPLSDWEYETLGYMSTEIGAAILEAWGFPDAVAEAVRDQYAPTEPSPMTHLLHVAASAVHEKEFGLPGEGSYWESPHVDLPLVRLDAGRVAAAANQVAHRFHRFASALDARSVPARRAIAA